MKRCRMLGIFFAALAALLSDVMCAVVAYSYCDMLWGIRYACYSAPAGVAFLGAIPFIIGILLCALLSVFFRRKAHRGQW